MSSAMAHSSVVAVVSVAVPNMSYSHGIFSNTKHGCNISGCLALTETTGPMISVMRGKTRESSSCSRRSTSSRSSSSTPAPATVEALRFSCRSWMMPPMMRWTWPWLLRSHTAPLSHRTSLDDGNRSGRLNPVA